MTETFMVCWLQPKDNRKLVGRWIRSLAKQNEFLSYSNRLDLFMCFLVGTYILPSTYLYLVVVTNKIIKIITIFNSIRIKALISYQKLNVTYVQTVYMITIYTWREQVPSVNKIHCTNRNNFILKVRQNVVPITNLVIRVNYFDHCSSSSRYRS